MDAQRLTELRTDRLRMRRVRSADIDAIHAIMSDTETMQFWSTPPHSTLAETKKWFASMIQADQAGESDEFVLEFRGEVIGKLGAWRLPEIGFYVRRDYWGRGLASEALLRFISYARDLELDCLTADVDPRNTACLRLLAKCGFHQTGRKRATYVVDGQSCDSVYLKIDLVPPR